MPNLADPDSLSPETELRFEPIIVGPVPVEPANPGRVEQASRPEHRRAVAATAPPAPAAPPMREDAVMPAAPAVAPPEETALRPRERQDVRWQDIKWIEPTWETGGPATSFRRGRDAESGSSGGQAATVWTGFASEPHLAAPEAPRSAWPQTDGLAEPADEVIAPRYAEAERAYDEPETSSYSEAAAADTVAIPDSSEPYPAADQFSEPLAEDETPEPAFEPTARHPADPDAETEIQFAAEPEFASEPELDTEPETDFEPGPDDEAENSELPPEHFLAHAAFPPRRRAGIRIVAAGLAAALLGLGAYVASEAVPKWFGQVQAPSTSPKTAASLRASPIPQSGEPPGDPAQRAAYFLARAKAGDPAAQHDLGVLYAQGEGMTQDYASAAAWFREAAINGIVNAQYNLAVLYERGLGVPQNMSEALIWYHSAADRNHPAAQYNLAIAYAEGRGTPQNFVEAARWYHRAAEQGVVPAMVNFAILYEKGQGVETSTADAYAWYRAAARRGDAIAEKRGGELYQQFSPEERTRADALAASVAAGIHEQLPDTGPRPAAAANQGPDPVLKPGGLGRRSQAGSIGIDAGPPQAATVSPTPRSVTEIQRRLARAEGKTGPADTIAVDGITGRETSQAIRRYQQAQGLPVDGAPTLALLNYLRSTTAPPSPAARREGEGAR